MGQWLHMGPSQTGSVVVVVKQVTTQLQQALQGAARFSMGLPGSCKRMKIFFGLWCHTPTCRSSWDQNRSVVENMAARWWVADPNPWG